MGNAIIARLAPDRRSPWAVESPYPQRQDRVQDDIEEGLSNSGGGGGGSSIDTREVPMPQHQPWSDFTAANLLPSSVYLWACDEPQPGGSNPSRSDAWVAWIILITQMTLYTALIRASSGDDTSTSTETTGHYTLFSVAAAMYVMTSIAAADLGAGIALISEARMDMAAKRWVQRKMFGFMLLASFALLAAASIKVLFKTSSGDVELVVGAATVLFIADVDEKVMVVLKAIPSKWRLFWVLELIGLSAALALLGLRVTDSGSNVSRNDNYDGYEKYMLIYSWYFNLCIYPVFVTLISLLVNAIVAGPKEFLKKHVLGNGSRQDWLFAVVLALWIVTPLVLYFGFWVLIVVASIMSAVGIGRICWLFFVCKRSVCCRGSDQSISLAGYMNFQWTSSTKFRMICVPVGLFLVRIGLDILAIENNVAWWGIILPVSDEDWVAVPDAFNYALFHFWLLWCMCKEGGECPESREMPSSPEALNIVVTEPVMIAGSQRQVSVTESHEEGGSSCRLTRNLFFGFIQANALIIVYVFMFYSSSSENRWFSLLLSATFWLPWTLVGVCAAVSSTKGVAFWTLATYMLYIVAISILIWTSSGDSVNIFYFDWP